MLEIRYVRGMNKKSAKKNEWNDLAHAEHNAKKRNETLMIHGTVRVRSFDGFESDFYWITGLWSASRTKMREYTWLMRFNAGDFGSRSWLMRKWLTPWL